MGVKWVKIKQVIRRRKTYYVNSNYIFVYYIYTKERMGKWKRHANHYKCWMQTETYKKRHKRVQNESSKMVRRGCDHDKRKLRDFKV